MGNHAGNGRSAAPLGTLNDEGSAHLLGVRRHPVEAPAPFPVAVGQTHSIVRDGEPDPVGLEAQVDVDPAGPGVPEGVGQRVVRDGEETGYIADMASSRVASRAALSSSLDSSARFLAR